MPTFVNKSEFFNEIALQSIRSGNAMSARHFQTLLSALRHDSRNQSGTVQNSSASGYAVPRNWTFYHVEDYLLWLALKCNIGSVLQHAPLDQEWIPTMR